MLARSVLASLEYTSSTRLPSERYRVRSALPWAVGTCTREVQAGEQAGRQATRADQAGEASRQAGRPQEKIRPAGEHAGRPAVRPGQARRQAGRQL